MSMVPTDQQPVFSLSPDRIVLEAKGSGSFVISGLAHKQGGQREQLTCMASVGTNAKAARKVRSKRRRGCKAWRIPVVKGLSHHPTTWPSSRPNFMPPSPPHDRPSMWL